MLLVVEDAHWIDATTLEFIDLCLDQVAGTRVLILITARPTFQPGFGGHPIVSALMLNRLGREPITAIVNGLTGGKSLPTAVLEEIADKTDGVPLFVEELTKMLLESGEFRETPTGYELTTALSPVLSPPLFMLRLWHVLTGCSRSRTWRKSRLASAGSFNTASSRRSRRLVIPPARCTGSIDLGGANLRARLGTRGHIRFEAALCAIRHTSLLKSRRRVCVASWWTLSKNRTLKHLRCCPSRGHGRDN